MTSVKNVNIEQLTKDVVTHFDDKLRLRKELLQAKRQIKRLENPDNPQELEFKKQLQELLTLNEEVRSLIEKSKICKDNEEELRRLREENQTLNLQCSRLKSNEDNFKESVRKLSGDISTLSDVVNRMILKSKNEREEFAYERANWNSKEVSWARERVQLLDEIKRLRTFAESDEHKQIKEKAETTKQIQSNIFKFNTFKEISPVNPYHRFKNNENENKPYASCSPIIRNNQLNNSWDLESVVDHCSPVKKRFLFSVNNK